jgi:hypothetical protein
MFKVAKKKSIARGAILALLAASVWAAQTPSASGPIPSTFFAMTALKPTDLPKVTIGTLGHPSDFAWTSIGRSQGVYNFTGYDSYVTAATKIGLLDTTTNTLNMAFTLGMTPGWAKADQSSCSNPYGETQCTLGPDNVADWTNFITALMNHYNGKANPHIRYYELWNEINAPNFWTGTNAELVTLAKAAYPIIHADPNSMLLTPSVSGSFQGTQSTNGLTTMTNYLKAGGGQYADGGAWHGYIGRTGQTPYPWPEQSTVPGCADTYCYGSIIYKVTAIRQVFDANGMSGKPMYQTEGSWGEANVANSDDQIAWLARWVLLQAGLRTTANLQFASWYAWGVGASQNWGGIETGSLTPTPAGLAYGQVYQWLVGASIDQPCSSTSDGTWTCNLTRAGGYIAQAVWNTAGSKSFTPAVANGSFTQYRDLAGNTVTLQKGGSVAIGSKPILLEGKGSARPFRPKRP